MVGQGVRIVVERPARGQRKGAGEQLLVGLERGDDEPQQRHQCDQDEDGENKPPDALSYNAHRSALLRPQKTTAVIAAPMTSVTTPAAIARPSSFAVIIFW